MFQKTSIDTRVVGDADRVSFLEEEWRARLLGFQCTSHAIDGLLAQQSCIDLGQVRVSNIRANAHVIERTPKLVSMYPRESVFVNLVRAGESFFYQRGHCVMLRVGDALIYDARYLYLLGGDLNFELLHLDIPAQFFSTRLAIADLRQPIQITSTSSTNRRYKQTLSALLLSLFNERIALDEDASVLNFQICDLLNTMVGQVNGMESLLALSVGHLLAAKRYIDKHLADEDLRPPRIVQAVGVSERHLQRLFAEQDFTIADFVLGRRLDRARQDLLERLNRASTVAEVAYGHGFTSPSHFSHAFKKCFGMTHSELKKPSRTD